MHTSTFASNFNKTKLTEKLLLLYVVLLPVMQVSIAPALGNKIQYADLVFFILCISFFSAWRAGRVNLGNTPFLGILAALAVVFTLSLKNAVSLPRGGIELAGFLYLCALYFMVNQLCRRDDFYVTVLAVWTGTAIVAAALGIIFYLICRIGGAASFFILDFTNAYNCANRFLSIRLRSFLIHPNTLAAYLHVSMVFLCVLLVRIRRSRMAGILGVVAFVLFFLALFWTKSRLTAGVFLSFFLISLYWQKKNVLRVFSYILFAITVMLLIFSVVSIIWWIFPVDFSMDAARGTGTMTVNLLGFPYYFQYQAAVNMFKARPFLGAGLGSFNYWAAKYVDWEAARASYLVMDHDLTRAYGKGFDPHSTYFGLLAETGLCGLIAVLLLMFLFIRRLGHLVSGEQDSGRKYALWCLLAGIAGFLWNGIYIEILSMRFFWFLLAMAAVLPRKRGEG